MTCLRMYPIIHHDVFYVASLEHSYALACFCVDFASYPSSYFNVSDHSLSLRNRCIEFEVLIIACVTRPIALYGSLCYSSVFVKGTCVESFACPV